MNVKNKALRVLKASGPSENVIIMCHIALLGYYTAQSDAFCLDILSSEHQENRIKIYTHLLDDLNLHSLDLSPVMIWRYHSNGYLFRIVLTIIFRPLFITPLEVIIS